MFRKLLTIGFLGFISTTALAADTAQTVTIQAGQGTPTVVVIPAAPQNAPYALTGKNESQPPELVQMRFGQADVFVAKN